MSTTRPRDVVAALPLLAAGAGIGLFLAPGRHHGVIAAPRAGGGARFVTCAMALAARVHPHAAPASAACLVGERSRLQLPPHPTGDLVGSLPLALGPTP